MEAFLKIIKTPQVVETLVETLVETPGVKTPSLIKQKRAKTKSNLKNGTSTPKGLTVNESDLEFSKFTPMKKRKENIPTPWEDDSTDMSAPVKNEINEDDHIVEDGSETDNESSSASSVYDDIEEDAYDALSRDDDDSNEYGDDDYEEDIGVSYETETDYTHRKTTRREPKQYARKVCRVPITYDDSTDYLEF